MKHERAMRKISACVSEEVVGDRFGRYSKYIIQDRAIPDVRDGLKPVQRRILYAMYDSGNTPDKPYRKSAKTVGDVMGNYHPHGDSSIYEGMVRMAQPWKMGACAHRRSWQLGLAWMMIRPAAMRYTEARLSPIAMELLRDIEKRTVLFKDNFDNTTKEPVVLPSRYPNLLVNGVSGISSGFATEIPPHNLREVIDACIAMMENPEMTLERTDGDHQRSGFSDRRHHHGRRRNSRSVSRPAKAGFTSARKQRSRICAAAGSKSSSPKFRIRSSNHAGDGDGKYPAGEKG